MRFSGVLGRLAVVLLARSAAALPAEAATDATDDASTAVASAIIKPKVFIISMVSSLQQRISCGFNWIVHY